MKSRPLLIALACIAAAGCRAFQPAAEQGHDLLDNPGRSVLIRGPAALGAVLGHAIAVPVGLLLIPTWFFEDAVVEGCDQLAPAGERGDSPRSDLQIPLVQAAFEYSSGVGAAVIGQPFEWVASGFRDPPGPSPGTVRETPEPPPGTPDPGASFAVRPPASR